jgi:hypothetical protein
MRLWPLLFVLALIPLAGAHGSMDSGPLAPGAEYTWAPYDLGEVTIFIDGIRAGTIQVTARGGSSAHAIEIGPGGEPDISMLEVKVGDRITWTNNDDETHRVTGSIGHAPAEPATNESPLHLLPWAFLGLVALSWSRKR